MPTKTCKLFVNLPVKQLEKSIKFFNDLGFDFDPWLTDERAGGMIVGEDALVIFLTEDVFNESTKGRKVCDSPATSEAILAVSSESKQEVDDLVRTAVGAGGEVVIEPNEQGPMYSGGFSDPDGHLWEVFWMDPEALED